MEHFYLRKEFKLAAVDIGTTSISYTYNDSGIRTSKTVNGVTTTYTNINGTITSQKDGTNEIYFRYDQNNSLTEFSLNGTEYLYVKNGQGDITGILDMNGNKVVTYSYDSWGKVERIEGSLADTVGKINPMRYKGYYQDEETGFFYVGSRYYDAGVCRFINADEYSYIDMSSPIGTNLFAYCNNNTVNMVDEDGCRPRYIEAGTHRMWSRILTKTPKYFNTFYGSARKYKSIIGGLNTPNCYAFAIGYSSALNPGMKSGRYPAFNDVKAVADAVIEDLWKMGKTGRKISGPNAPILNDEYRIAVRCGTRGYEFKNNKFYYSDTSEDYDYHFMVQMSNGCWAEKHGIGGNSIIHNKGENPNNLSWNLGNLKGYYNSPIIYIAVGVKQSYEK